MPWAELRSRTHDLLGELGVPPRWVLAQGGWRSQKVAGWEP